MSFGRRLVIWLAVLLAPLIISDVYTHYEQYLDNRDNAFRQQMRTAEQLASSIEVFVERTVAVQRSAGRALIVSHWHDPLAAQAYIDSVLDSVPTLRQIALADPSGRVVQGSPRNVIGRSIADREYFRAIQSGANWSVSNVLVSRFTGQPAFVIASAIRSDAGTLQGVVVSGIDEEALVTSLHIQPSPETRLVLLDSDGRVAVASGFGNARLIGEDWSGYASVQDALQGRIAHIDRFHVENEPALTGSVVPVPLIGWVASAFVPRSEVVAPVRQAAVRDALITAIVLLITLGVATILARQMVRPIERLSDAAERLGHGELGTRASIPATEELATLAATMNQMAESIQQRDQALREAYERERRIATLLQQRMLPEVPERVGHIELAVGYFPALEEAEIGGDFYDVMLLPDGLVGLLIADVSGKGLSAAVNTAMAKYMLEGFVHEDPDPARALCRLNRAIRQYSGDDRDWRFITAFLGILDTMSGRLVYANAGHLQPILRHADGSIELLAMPSGPPINVADEPDYRPEMLQLARGDTLLGYTDGVVEARHDGEWFSDERLLEIVASAASTPDELIVAVHKAVIEFTDNHPTDDIALLSIRMAE